jgi:AraC-like DNA-binding protein
MKLYYGTSRESTDCAYDGYFKINNCGCFADITDNCVTREHGRLDYQLIYIKSGEITVEEDAGNVLLSAGDIYLFRPGEPQRYRVEQSTTYFWIHFTGTAVNEMLAFFEATHYRIGPLPEIEDFCRSFYRDYRLPLRFQPLFYEGRLISLFGKIAERKQSADNTKKLGRIAAVLDYIEDVFPHKPSNEELASFAYMSKYHFIKVFKATMGETPQSYLNRLLMDKAKLLLQSTALSVAEISQKLGVEDPLYFSRLFKKHYGISPSYYRGLKIVAKQHGKVNQNEAKKEEIQEKEEKKSKHSP